jgi:hypothetical protein
MRSRALHNITLSSGVNLNTNTVVGLVPLLLPFSSPLRAHSLRLVKAVTTFLSILLCFVSFLFHTRDFFAGLRWVTEGGPSRTVFILGTSKTSFDGQSEENYYYPHPSIDPQFLDLRRNPPSTEHDVGDLGETQHNQPLPQPRSELRDTPPSLDRFIPPDQYLLQPQPQPQHNLFQPRSPPQGPDVPPNTCPNCQSSFPKPFQLKYVISAVSQEIFIPDMLTRLHCSKHLKTHTRPHKCPVETCPSPGFQLRKDRDRHMRSKHPEQALYAKKYHCTVENCGYSERGGKFLARRDHLRRHMKHKHPQDR